MKRKRYSHEDDILLAQFYLTNPSGTVDSLFQAFAREVSLEFFYFVLFVSRLT